MEDQNKVSFEEVIAKRRSVRKFEPGKTVGNAVFGLTALSQMNFFFFKQRFSLLLVVSNTPYYCSKVLVL